MFSVHQKNYAFLPITRKEKARLCMDVTRRVDTHILTTPRASYLEECGYKDDAWAKQIW